MFRDAYAQRRYIVPVDGFFEWRAIKGARAKQPYAIALKDGSAPGEWERTFAIITVLVKRACRSSPRPHVGDH